MKIHRKPCKECKLIKPLGELTGLCLECLDWEYHNLINLIIKENGKRIK